MYFTSADGRLLAVDAARRGGSRADRRAARGLGRVAGALPEPVIVDGRVYAGAPDGTVFAVDGSDPAGW